MEVSEGGKVRMHSLSVLRGAHICTITLFKVGNMCDDILSFVF